MKCNDVEDLGDKFLVSIQNNKNDYPGQFIIGNLFYDTVKKYILLRPTEQFTDRFFIQYQKGKCIRQPIGRHKIGETPENIASYLGLENAKRYTGHCFRRTASTLLSESGANMQMVKQLGRWRSDLIAQGYIENSMHNREILFNGIIHEAAKKKKITDSRPSTRTKTIDNYSRPSTSTDIGSIYSEPPMSTDVMHRPTDAESFNLEWSDFSDEFTLNKSNPIPSKH